MNKFDPNLVKQIREQLQEAEAGLPHDPEFAERALQKAKDAADELRELRAGTKRRAGYTTNKSRGTAKTKRLLAAASRHRNRGKR